jgi:predicted aspartyl protease
MRRPRRLVLGVALGLSLGLAACAGGPKISDCALIKLAETPLEVRGTLQFVPATIAGQPVTFLVDTGAERTLLTEAAAARLGLKRDPHRITQTYGIGGPSSNMDATLPDGLTLGGTRFPVDRVAVGHFGIEHVPGAAPDGLLGADILLAFDMDLNSPAGRMTLWRARRCGPTKPPWSVPSIEIDGVGSRRDRLVLPIALDGASGQAILDTGAQATTVSLRFAHAAGVTDIMLATDRTVIAHGAAPNALPLHVHHFGELRIGPAVIRDPFLPVVPQESGFGDALVGGDFLLGRRVWLAFATHQMFVTPLVSGR